MKLWFDTHLTTALTVFVKNAVSVGRSKGVLPLNSNNNYN